jgi:hypothetical protein
MVEYSDGTNKHIGTEMLLVNFRLCSVLSIDSFTGGCLYFTTSGLQSADSIDNGATWTNSLGSLALDVIYLHLLLLLDLECRYVLLVYSNEINLSRQLRPQLAVMV